MPDRSGRDPAGLVRGLVHLAEDLAGARQVGAPRVGEVDPARTPVEQLHAELGLQPADRLRQRRLGHGEPFGGAPEVQLLGDCDEVPQVTQIHIVSILIRADTDTSLYQGRSLASMS